MGYIHRLKKEGIRDTRSARESYSCRWRGLALWGPVNLREKKTGEQ